MVQLNTRSIVSFEALLRWDHPTQGLISPYRFIEAAEDTGILVSIGHWLIVPACRPVARVGSEQCIKSTDERDRQRSARQFADARLVNDLQDALQETGIDPARLQLEMKEAIAASDPKLTITVLAHLKHMGIRAVLDDFGTGAMSLVQLTQFPVDALKIDRSLIRDMQSDKTASDVIELIMTMAHKMKYRVIAEGIETPRQLERLVELGCEYGQGYCFSQPMEAKSALIYMRTQLAGGHASGAGAK